MTIEQERVKIANWKKWGPYVSDRQWGTVREDYSINGDAWNFTTHDMARSKTYRWGEEGIAGICDDEQLLCFAVSLWNKKDPILKERFFGLTNTEGNHGEDVKELYYYLDNTPTHSYMKMLYKYPQTPFPYIQLFEENRRRTKQDPEFELIDTGVFDDNLYFDIVIEYAKQSPQHVLIRISIHNRGSVMQAINVLPTLWFRNTWIWGYDAYKPQLIAGSAGIIEAFHQKLGQYYLQAEGLPELMFCNNETNTIRLYGYGSNADYYKDGINDYLTRGVASIDQAKRGTKAAFNYDLIVPAGEQVVVRLSLSQDPNYTFDNFDQIFSLRKAEADAFYAEILKGEKNPDVINIKRQALSGLLWNKQFYYYDVHQWLKGDPGQPQPPLQRSQLRNTEWKHLHSKEILSVPDKWEFPWFAAWDMAFHCFTLAMVDMDFAKSQLLYMVNEWYMHPNGQLPAYEWNFSDCNPPIHAMAIWEIYKTEKQANQGRGDVLFLEKIFHKLMLNFNWWVNRKDAKGNNIFEGGFLGLDNIGVIDRSKPLPNGGYLQQSDATGWMAMYALNLIRIAHELLWHNPAYTEITSKYFEHFLYIAGAMSGDENLWDDEDNFYYDRLLLPDNVSLPLKIRSMVGLISLFVVETAADSEIKQDPFFDKRRKWFEEHRPDLANLVMHWNRRNKDGIHLFSLMRGFRMKMMLKRLLDENEFLSDYGIRSLSKFHLQHPYQFNGDEQVQTVKYTPGESDNNIFGGNSNWRGPVWLPMNWLVIESLRRYYSFYGDDFKVECPTASGRYMTLNEVADELSHRVFRIFERNAAGNRPVFGSSIKMQRDDHFKDHLLFYEYFHGDTGIGLGASHQTGWTALIATYTTCRP